MKYNLHKSYQDTEASQDPNLSNPLQRKGNWDFSSITDINIFFMKLTNL